MLEEIHNKIDIYPKLAFGAINIAVDKIVAAGHSFGGMTALRASLADGRVKAVVTYDPWLYVYESDLTHNQFKVERPLFSIQTEYFTKMCEYDQT